MLVGLISDTHALVRPEALAALEGVALILHAGDVGDPRVLHALGRVAPVQAVCGNVDDPAAGWPQTLSLTLDGVRVRVTHGHDLGSPTPRLLAARYPADVIVYGHTHKGLIEHVAGTLIVNPGAAGPRRFHLSPSVAMLHLSAGRASAELVPLG